MHEIETSGRSARSTTNLFCAALIITRLQLTLTNHHHLIFSNSVSSTVTYRPALQKWAASESLLSFEDGSKKESRKQEGWQEGKSRKDHRRSIFLFTF